VRTPELSNLDELARRMEILRDHAAEIGRTEPIDVCFSPFAAGASKIVDELHALESLGVTWAVLHGPPAQTRQAWIDGTRRVADEIVAAYRG
jgi:hypothetical protein